MNKRKATNPSPFASIVVGVDDAGLSDHAVRLGLDLGRRLSTRVDLVHAVPTPPDVWPGIDPVRGAALTAELLTGALRTINAHVRSVVRVPESPGVDAKGSAARATAVVAAPPDEDLVRVIPGQPAKVLLDHVREKKAGLIVLGGHQKREFLDFGSTLRAVFARATVPLWIQAQPFRPIQTILVPVDLSEESRNALAMACSLARAFGARVSAVHCFHVSSYAITAGLDYSGYAPAFPIEAVRKAEQGSFERTMHAFDWGGVGHTVEFVDGEPVQKILELSRAADLIVMGTHGRTGLASVVLGGTAYSILKHSEKPVLAARHSERMFLI
jgi:nucleotide-binding universal stress UspA family protein